MMARFSLLLDGAAPSETAIEDRIAHIRTNLLPPFTVDPPPASDCEPEPEPERLPTKPPAANQASRLRQPTARRQVSTAAPRANHRGGAVTGTRTLPGPSSTINPIPRQVQAADVRIPPRQCVASGTGPTTEGDIAETKKTRRLSRRGYAARTRWSTMFGRGEGADILRVRTPHRYS